MNVPLQHNILCSVRSPIDNIDEKWNFMQKAGIHRLEIYFLYYKWNRVCCNENPLSIAILYKKISYLQNRP